MEQVLLVRVLLIYYLKKKLNKGLIRPEDIPYMQRPGGMPDNSDLKKKLSMGGLNRNSNVKFGFSVKFWYCQYFFMDFHCEKWYLVKNQIRFGPAPSSFL